MFCKSLVSSAKRVLPVAVENSDFVGYMKTTHTFIGQTVADNGQGFILHPSCSKRCYQSLTGKRGLTQTYTVLGHKWTILNDVCKGETTREVESRMPKYL